MKTLFTTFSAVLVTLCTTSTALSATQAPALGASPEVTAPAIPKLYYSESRL